MKKYLDRFLELFAKGVNYASIMNMNGGVFSEATRSITL